MHTDANKDSQVQCEFQPTDNPKVVSDFGGGQITSDAGGLLWRERSKQTGILTDVAGW